MYYFLCYLGPSIPSKRILSFRRARCRYCGRVLNLLGEPTEALFRIWAHFLKEEHDLGLTRISHIYKVWPSLSEEEKVKVIRDLLRKYFIPLTT
ncbi:MAG: hypothetical protein DRZ82_05840 [Thermoprotei archaeon]|nr:MAG: hypothetical protein DRZ82_05840 [Thermoprotei archaeon]